MAVAPKDVLQPLDMHQLEIMNMVFQQLATAPTSPTPVEGQTYWNTATNRLSIYDGSAWGLLASDSDLLGGHNSAYHLARGNHTGSQTASTISDFDTQVRTSTLNQMTAPTADLSINSHKLTGVSDGSSTNDAVNFGQLSANATADRSRTNHTGTQTASTISDFDTQVRTSTLNQMTAPSADLSINSHKLTNVSDGTSAGDAINKGQLDAAIQGLDNKHTAEFASTANLSVTYSNGSSGVGATLTATGNGAISLDGGSPGSGELVLIKDQSSAFQNGLYVVTTVGSGGAPFVLTRSTEMDTSTEFGGALVAVRQGTANGGSLYMASVSNSITVGTTNVPFVKLNSAVTLTEGDGIDITSNTISVVADTGISVSASGVAIDTAVVVRKYAASIGDGSNVDYTVTHNFGTRDVTVCVYDTASPYAEVITDVKHTTTNELTVSFAVAPTTNKYRVVVHG